MATSNSTTLIEKGNMWRNNSDRHAPLVSKSRLRFKEGIYSEGMDPESSVLHSEDDPKAHE